MDSSTVRTLQRSANIGRNGENNETSTSCKRTVGSFNNWQT